MNPSTDTTDSNGRDSNLGGPLPAETTPLGEGASLPISLSVVIVIADARRSTRVFEAGREQSYAATPEAFVALPSRLNSMVRGAGEDAQRELNKFLAQLALPEPPATEPPTGTAAEPPTPRESEPESLT